MQAQQRRQLREQDQKRSSLCKTAKHRRGDHLHDPSKARHAHHHLQSTRQDRHPGGKRHPLRAARLRKTGERSPDQQARERGGPYAKAGGRAPEHRHQRRQQRGIDTGHQGHARQRGVRDALGHEHQSHCEARRQLAQ